MRSSRFRSGGAIKSNDLRGTVRSQRINWDKRFYLGLLVVIGLAVGYYVFHDFLYIESEGQIITGTFDVRFAEPVRLVEILGEERELVNAGDALFTYRPAEIEVQIEDEEELPNASMDDFFKDRIDINRDIALIQIDRREKEKLLAFYLDEEQRIKRGVYLDIYTIEELAAVRAKVSQWKAEIAALDQENFVLRAELSLLEQRREEPLKQAREAMRMIYHSPVEGVIQDIYKKEAEVALVSERIMTLQLTAFERIHVKTLFGREALDYITEGGEVSLVHDNGEESRGRVIRLTVGYSDQANPNQPRFAGMEQMVVADIYPASEEDREIWKRLQNMSVTVYQWKWEDIL